MLSLLALLSSLPICSSSTSLPPLAYSCRPGTWSECKKVPFVPGHTLLGEGFDIVTMKKTRAFLLNLQRYAAPDKTCTVCNNPHKKGALQKLPLALVDWRPQSSCSRKITSEVSRSTLSLAKESASSVQNDWEAGLELQHKAGSAKLVLAGSQSELARFTQGKTSTDRYSFVRHQLSCSYYSFRLTHNPPLGKEFYRALQGLPASYNTATRTDYRQLIKTYGTHFIRQAEAGGHATEVTAIKTCKVALDGMSMEELKDCLSVEASAAVTGTVQADAKAKACRDLSQNSNQGESFHQTFTERSWEITGGKVTFELLSFDVKSGGEAGAFGTWMESLKTDPDVVTYSLEPIHTLVRFNGPQKVNLQKAVSEYIMEKALRENCSCSGSSQPSREAECSCVCLGSRSRNMDCCPINRGMAKLVVTIQRANGLWGDYGSNTDAYVKLSVGTENTQTPTIWNNNNPRWDIRFDVGIVELSSSTSLKMEVWDEDNKYDDDLLGKCEKSVTSGEKSDICYLQHGSITYKLDVTCVPHLTGPHCRDYASATE